MSEKDIVKSEYTFDYFKEETLLLREENKQLQEQKEKAIKYMEHYIEVEDAPLNENVRVEFKEVIKILNGENQNG